MALPSSASLLASLEVRLGAALSGADRTRAEAVITDASALVSSVGGATATGGDAAASAAVVAVLLAVARRAYLNRAGVAQETVGPFSVTWGSAWLTAEERALLIGGRTTGGLWSLGTTRGDSLETNWVYDQWADGTLNGGDPIPFETRPLR